MAEDSDLEPGMMAEITAGFVLVVVGLYFAFVGLEWPAVSMFMSLGGLAAFHRYTTVVGN